MTWNPVVGCTKISEGCRNCYAERMAFRLANIYATRDKYGPVIERDANGWFYPNWNGEVYFDEKELNRKFPGKGKKIFVCSMGDLFHEMVQYKWIESILRKIRENPQHIFQILTKRIDVVYYHIWNEIKYFEHYYSNRYADYQAIPNLWLGVTVENEKEMERIDYLKRIPAAVRFVSFEPLLENIPNLDLSGIDWVIVGGETWPGARYMDVHWVNSIFEAAKKNDIPFFFKGNGTGLVFPDAPKNSNMQLHFKKTDKYYMYYRNQTWNEFPEVKP